MAKKTAESKAGKNPKSEKKMFLPTMPKAFRRAVLASIGALSLGGEEAKKVFIRLVDEGKQAQDKWAKRLKRVISRS